TTIAHEVGHILNLMHTHQGETDGCTNCGTTCMPGNADQCSDTLADSTCFDLDGVSGNAFGVPYSQLNAGQQAQVDMTWGNLMSYHDPNNRSRLSLCQMDRQSTEAYADRTRLLSKIPIYVDVGYGGSPSGSFAEPYQTLQQAINAGANGKTVV